MIQFKDKMQEAIPGRNELCPCGSRLKFKFCHGDPKKAKIIKAVIREAMGKMIIVEQMRKGLREWPWICNTVGCGGCLTPKASEVAEGVSLCPKCGSVAEQNPRAGQMIGEEGPSMIKLHG